MKYLSLRQIQEALTALQPHHPIFATTYLVLKKAGVPVGSKVRFSLDAANRAFLEQFYRVHPKSKHFLRVTRQNDPQKDWNRPAYAGKGLQSVNTRGSQAKAFIHDRNDNTWGWSKDYVATLKELLPKGQKLPLLHLATWIYRERAWKDALTRKDVIQAFIDEYGITKAEIASLFDITVCSPLPEKQAFQNSPAKWHQILAPFEQPDDVPPEEGGILRYLELSGIGPCEHLCFEPAKRLNIITGDNGLGKTFLLDLSWWALTREWAERPPMPSFKDIGKVPPTIKFSVGGMSNAKISKAVYRRESFDWNLSESIRSISGLVVYARVDGSFSVWDPINRILDSQMQSDNYSSGVKFTREEVWDGKGRQIEGLIRDWVKWQERQDKYPAFGTFQAVLRRMSPPDLGSLEIAEPQRLPGEKREMPALKHPYGDVPIIHESAGIKRIVTLAYLIVWAWEEHKIQAKQFGKPEERQMVVILDEAEAHLHPKWQRVIMPALLGIGADLSQELSIQFIVASHSPLVLASAESVFNEDTDKLFHLDMSVSGKVSFKETPFTLLGSSDAWLMSPIFAVKHPGSPKREEAIEAAIKLQQQPKATKEAVEAATVKLRDTLPAEDPFWLRWLFFAQKHDVKV